MASFKKVIVAIAVILFFSQSHFAQTRSASSQFILERLLDGHHVINIVDDFLVFWERARFRTPAAQRRLWKRLVEDKHRDYFERAVYRTSDPDVRRAMLDEFLMRVPSQIEAIREFNRSVYDLRVSPLFE